MNKVSGKAYNYQFAMFMEGVQVPFKSANIVCTPNGVEMNINVHVSETLFNIKLKTAVQIMFREWYGSDRAWRLMGDGFFSATVVGEDSTGGRAVSLVCRDFRMDIRKSPAAIAYMGVEETPGEPQALFSVNGVFQNIVTKQLVVDKKSGETSVKIKSKPVELYNQTGLMDLAFSIGRIAGTAYGVGAGKGGGAYDAFSFSTSEVTDAAMQAKNGKKYANGGLFLDSFIRGIWMEAVGGTTVNAFLNKRIRADKRFLVPRNYAGFNFWTKNNFGLEVGSAVMGSSRFSSLEAAMMNVAGMFSCRVYSCSTPSLISIREKNEYVIDEKARDFAIKLGEFGAPYLLNQTMLLPPLEFTAPPNCNLFFPPMYDRISWQHDADSDITRCYFGVIHALDSPGGGDFGRVKFQIPNDLFGVVAQRTDATKNRLPLTLEERYNGVNVYHGTVEFNLAAGDAARSQAAAVLNKKGKEKIEAQQAVAEKAKGTLEKVYNAAIDFVTAISTTAIADQAVKAAEKAQEEASKAKAKQKLKEVMDGPTATAYKRHAMIKYINLKYAGRVVSIDMAFNPFVMAGFPGAIISANEELGTNVTKSIIGMVQQVSHNIYITAQQAEATTTVIMNNTRFEDEPTDLDANGLPLYIEATKKSEAKVDLSTGKFVNETYRVPNAQSPNVIDESSSAFDLKEEDIGGKGYRFVKDFLSTSQTDLSLGKEESIYVDMSYEPNRIFHFYKTVFGHEVDHFMIGTFADPESNGEVKPFAYNSMHEAMVALRRDHPELLTDYDECINFVKRNICSADAFFHGILGLSSLEDVSVGGVDIGLTQKQYVNRKEDFLDSTISESYWGIASEDLTDKIMSDLHMSGAGQFSSIREHLPITAFIAERRLAVEEYLNSVLTKATGVYERGR